VGDRVPQLSVVVNGDQCRAEPAHSDGQIPTGTGEKDNVAALRTEVYRAGR